MNNKIKTVQNQTTCVVGFARVSKRKASFQYIVNFIVYHLFVCKRTLFDFAPFLSCYSLSEYLFVLNIK